MAFAGGDRDDHQRGKTELGSDAAIIFGYAVEHRAVIADEIELVHREHDMTDTEQRANQRMSPGLRQDALASIDQQHRQIRG